MKYIVILQKTILPTEIYQQPIILKPQITITAETFSHVRELLKQYYPEFIPYIIAEDFTQLPPPEAGKRNGRDIPPTAIP